jgi:MerR family transcriptional regulator, repressor of the yfmOP operon
VNLAPDKLRIGPFAALAGTTPRTIRYYEEIGLLPCPGERGQGQHRCYTRADVERVREIVRLRDLLGLSLEQLAQLIAADDPQAELLERVRARRRELVELERWLMER